MPRINVEDDLLLNPRFQALVVRLGGDMERALGRLVRFWWAAQRRWADNRSAVPKDEFELGAFEHLIETGFAIEKGDGVLARASEDQFEWIHQKHEAASEGGRKSAAARIAKYGTANPRATKQTGSACEAPLHELGSTCEADVKRTRTDVNAHTHSLTLTHKKKNNPPASQSSPDPEDLTLADEWIIFARSRSDTANPDRGKYAKAMKQMRGLGLSAEDIRKTLTWIKASEFWSKVAWSPVQLVKSKDGVRKLDTVRAQMKDSASQQSGSQGYLVLTEEGT